MPDYGKIVKDKLMEVGAKVSDATSAAVDKAKETAKAAVKVVTGNDGALGSAKEKLKGREAQLATEEAKMANGGLIGRKVVRKTNRK